MKTVVYSKIQTKKVGRKFAAETSFNFEDQTTKIDYTQWGDSEQQAIDKLMKFLSSDGKYNLKCR